MIGGKFGFWEIIDFVKDKKQKHRSKFYLCKCKCGKESIIRSDQLKSGRSSGCKDCYKIRWKTIITKHGLHKTSTYDIWRGIKKMLIAFTPVL